MKKTMVFIVLGVLAALAAFHFIRSDRDEVGAADGEPGLAEAGGEPSDGRIPDAEIAGGSTSVKVRPPSDDAEDAEPEAAADADTEEAADDKLVDEFDAETDRWMEAGKTPPPEMKDVEAFRAKFQGLPRDRKEECLQRALNLIPDENVMLLAGILMDKSEDKELVELIFNDVLNRDEDVKKPILQAIFRDREHPCWTDTAWIFDVTGEQPDVGARAHL